MEFGVDLECGMDFKETIELASLSEEMGYDCVTVAEHHNADGYSPQPLIALAALAARTTRIQLASNIVILPLYHPVIVAEQTAMVQFISEGRLICGVGLGYVPGDFESLGVPYGERAGRMEESLALLPRLWRETDVSHVGKFFEFSHATVRPRLDDLGAPPLLAGGWVEAAIRRAARLTDGWVPGPTVDFDALRHCYAIFRDERERHGKSLDIAYPAMRELFCAPTRQQALEVGGDAMYRFYRDTYLQWPHPYLGEAERRMNYDQLANKRFIIGDPADCSQAIAELAELGITRLTFRMQPPGVSWRDALASMKLLMEEVVPRFR